MRKTNYDKFPCITVPASDGTCVASWPVIGQRLRDTIKSRGAGRAILAVECYPGVDEAALIELLTHEIKPSLAVRSSGLMLPDADINCLCDPFLGGDDRT